MKNPILDKWLKRDYLYGLALADLHIMHATGLAPVDGWVTSTGNVLQPNEAQSYLGECWAHLVDRLPKRLDFLFLVGDMVEGRNPIDQARELSEVDPEFQARAATEVLQPLVDRTSAIFMVAGSDYHAGRGSRNEEALGRMLHTRKKGPFHAPPWRIINVMDDVMFDVAHTQSYMMRYRSTPMERELEFATNRKARARSSMPPIYVIVRAHTHTGYAAYEKEGALVVTLPCFKIQDIYAKKSRTPNRMVPENLGAVGFKVYKEPKDGKLVHTIPYLYEHPEDPPERL